MQANVDRILDTMNQQGVAYLLIGGMNFMLRHQPALLTYDIDLWIDDSLENRTRCESALASLDAEWGSTDADWGLVANRPAGWLSQQSVFSLNSPHGAIDIFRFVPGLADWNASMQSALPEQTRGGVAYRGLNDEDMLKCQLALDPSAQKPVRVQTPKSPSRSAMNESFSELLHDEQAKRERNWNPQLRWQVVQETIAWAAAQRAIRRNTKEACLANQRRLIASIARYQQNAPVMNGELSPIVSTSTSH